MRKITILFSLLFTSALLSSQCNSWIDSPKKDDAETAHTIYRGALKAYKASTKEGDLSTAFENWEKAYEMAPAADGKRDYHFTNGAELYIAKMKLTTDEAEKKAMKAKVLSLYDEAIACYEAGGIVPSKCEGNPECITKKVGYIQGRKAADMYYHLQSPYSENLAAYEKCLELAGNDAEYTVFDPIAAITVYQFQKGKIDKAKTLGLYNKLEQLAANNTGSQYADYYQQAFKAAKSKFTPIEGDIFDCEYFKPGLKAEYDAEPNNPEVVKSVLVRLKRNGCAESDPLVKELEGKWKSYASKVNAERQAEFEANNPSLLANKAYKAGNYDEAISKYKQAINEEADNSKKAGHHLSIASILFRKQKKLQEARTEARTALGLRPNWAKALNMIGDMYATGARNCGDSWNQRLAIIAAIDKYQAAKSDPEYASDAQGKISKYSSSLPAQDEGFMRGVKKGDRVKVGCWIGETVTVKFQ